MIFLDFFLATKTPIIFIPLKPKLKKITIVENTLITIILLIIKTGIITVMIIMLVN